jgi:hypothetical protein
MKIVIKGIVIINIINKSHVFYFRKVSQLITIAKTYSSRFREYPGLLTKILL